MIAYRRIVIRVLFVLMLAGLAGAPAVSADIVAPESQAFAEVDTTAQFLEEGLEKRGFEVGRGSFVLWGIDECPATFELMGGCYFNNPTSPYVLSAVPYWEDEFVDPATAHAFGDAGEDYGPIFRFDPNEAIVIFGFLPPEAAYFGLQSYLFTRKGEWETDNDTYRFIEKVGATDVFFHTVPLNASRISSFDSLSDSNNNVVIERQSGASWNQFRYFIITPDRFMEKQVRQVLHKLRVPEKDVFSEAIPSNMRIGLDADADDFLVLFRYSRPVDGGTEGTQSDEWRHNPTMGVLRIRDTRPHRPAQRYPAWVDDSPEPRIAVSEVYLKDDLNALVDAVGKAWAQPIKDEDDWKERALPFIDTQSYPFNLVGPLCDNIGMDCQGDTQDATYQFRPGLSFDNGEVYAVVGTLGTATGNATYVSLGLNNVHYRLGVKNVNDSMLAGSATEAFYGDLENLDELYVYYFTRDCEDVKDLTHDFCTSVEDTEFVIPKGGLASFVERDYVGVGTQRAPDSTLTLPAIALKLARPTP